MCARSTSLPDNKRPHDLTAEVTAFILLMSAIRQSLWGTACSPPPPCRLKKQAESWAKSPEVSFCHLAADIGCQQGIELGLLSKATCGLSMFAET